MIYPRTIAIGDVHGCFNALEHLLEGVIKPTTDDTIIFLGDLIDRGPHSKKVLNYIFHLEDEGFNVIRLLGNHEMYLIHSWQRRQNFHLLPDAIENIWFQVGAKATLDSFEVQKIQDIPQHFIDRLSQAKRYHLTDEYLFVHAGLDFTLDDPLSDEESMISIREFTVDSSKIGGRRIIHGHVPVSLELIEAAVKDESLGFIDIDNGVNIDKDGFGHLIAFDVTNKCLYHVAR